MLQARGIDQVDVHFLSNGNGSAFENSLDSGRISFRNRPCAMYKDNTVGNVVAEMGRDLVFGTTARLSDVSMPLTGEVRRSPEPSARPSAAADSEERQICTTCLFMKSVGLCLCFFPSCAMYKDNCSVFYSMVAFVLMPGLVGLLRTHVHHMLSSILLSFHLLSPPPPLSLILQLQVHSPFPESCVSVCVPRTYTITTLLQMW